MNDPEIGFYAQISGATKGKLYYKIVRIVNVTDVNMLTLNYKVYYSDYLNMVSFETKIMVT